MSESEKRTAAEIGLLAVLFFFGWTVYTRALARSDAATDAAWAAAAASRRAFHARVVHADSVEARARASVAGAAAGRAGLLRARSRADTASERLMAEIAAVRATVADSAATVDSLRRAASTLADQADEARAKFLAERDTAMQREKDLLKAQGDLVEAIDAKNEALDSAADLDRKNAELEQRLRDARPGVARRALSGLVAGGSAVGCGGLGWVLGGPLVGIVAAATCAAIAGAVSP